MAALRRLNTAAVAAVVRAASDQSALDLAVALAGPRSPPVSRVRLSHTLAEAVVPRTAAARFRVVVLALDRAVRLRLELLRQRILAPAAGVLPRLETQQAATAVPAP
jgi:hypothetical protein